MNVEFKNLKDNEWITTDDEGRMRFVKTDAQTEEMEDILNKEDVLELLRYNKERVLEDIDKTRDSLKENKKLSISTLIVISIAIGGLFIINNGYSALMIPSLFTGLGFLGILEGIVLLKHKGDKKLMAICEERLQEIKEEEPALEKEIAELKEKHNFIEEAKELNYFENLSYENTEEKRLVRTRTRK